MDERVWEKTAQFLKELRCEDTGRLSQLQLPEYQQKNVRKKKTNKLICRGWWICCFYYLEAEY